MKFGMNYTKISIAIIAAFIVVQCGQNLFCTQKKEVMVDAQGKVCDSMLELLKLTGVEHDGTLVSIVKATQAQWLRKPGQERWDIVEQDWAQRDVKNNLFKKMGIIDEIKPASKEYAYALLMGATVSRVKMRLQSLIDVWNDGVRFNEVVILSGARPLIDSELQECAQNYPDALPATEADMMKLVYAHAIMSEDMRQVPLFVIDVPMLETVDGTLRLPTTGDTVDLWLKSNPVPCKCLVVSNQPYVFYQDSVAKGFLPQTFTVESFGQADVNSGIGIHLDNLARCLYQEKARLGIN